MAILMEATMEKPRMNLYHLQRTTQLGGRDETVLGLVVRATSETHARQIAATVAGDEGPNAWRLGWEVGDDGEAHPVTCELLTADGEAGVVCRDYY